MLAPLGAAIGAISLPVLGVVAAVAALAAIAFLVIKNWDKIKEFFSNLWEGVKNIFSAALESIVGGITDRINKIKDFFSDLLLFFKGIFTKDIQLILESLWHVINAILGEKIATLITNFVENTIKFFTNLWETVKKIFSTAWEFIKNFVTAAWNGIINFFTGTRDKFINIFQVIKDKVLSIWDGIVSGIKGFVNTIIRAINAMISGMNKLRWDVPDWVPVIGGKSWGISIPMIPYLAKGGDILQSGWAMVGEQGPELLHLPRGAQVQPLKGGAQEVRHSGTITVRGVNDAGQLMGAVDIVISALGDVRVQRKLDEVSHRNRVTTLRPQGVY